MYVLAVTHFGDFKQITTFSHNAAVYNGKYRSLLMRVNRCVCSCLDVRGGIEIQDIITLMATNIAGN